MKTRDKLIYTAKFNTVAVLLTLAALGAGQVKENLRWGTAMASEVKKVTVENIAIPQELDVPSGGKARCLGNARNETQKARCHEIFAAKLEPLGEGY